MENNLRRYTIAATELLTIAAGDSLTVQVSGEQGTELGTAGELTAELLFATTTNLQIDFNIT